MSTLNVETCHHLTDAHRNMLNPSIPVPSPLGRPRECGLRDLIDGIRHCIGYPWRDVPARYGP